MPAHHCTRLRRDAEAQCGTDSTPADGSACQDGPGWEEQHVCGMCGVLFDTSYPMGAHTWSIRSEVIFKKSSNLYCRLDLGVC